MKRILSILLTIALAASFLGGIPAYSEAPYVLNEFEQEYNVSYFYGSDLNWLGEAKAPSSMKICSSEDLNSCFADWQDIILKYDDNFFKEKFLVFVYWGINRRRSDFRVTSVSEKGDSINIEITSDNVNSTPITTPERWIVILEMDSELSEKDISVCVPFAMNRWFYDAVYFETSGNHSFGTVTVPYDLPEPYSVPALIYPGGELAASLSGDNPDSFTLSTRVWGGPAIGRGIVLTVTPNENLAVGTYTATVTVIATSVTDSYEE